VNILRGNIGRAPLGRIPIAGRAEAKDEQAIVVTLFNVRIRRRSALYGRFVTIGQD
jgi:hypothetical protein